MPSIAHIKFKVKQALVELFQCLQGKEHEAVDFVLEILKESARKTLKDYHEPNIYETNLLPSIQLSHENENPQSLNLYNIDQTELTYEDSCNNYNTPVNNSLLNNGIYTAGSKEQVDQTPFSNTSLDLNEDSTTRLCIDIDAEMNSNSLDYVSQIAKFIPLVKATESRDNDNASVDSHLHEHSNIPCDSSKTLFEIENGSTIKDNLVTLLTDHNDFSYAVSNHSGPPRYTLLEPKASTNEVIRPVAVYKNLSLHIEKESNKCADSKIDSEIKPVNKDRNCDSKQYNIEKTAKDSIHHPSPSQMHLNIQTDLSVQNLTASLDNSNKYSANNKLLSTDVEAEVLKNPITTGNISDEAKDVVDSDISNNMKHVSATIQDKINVTLESTSIPVKQVDQKAYNTRDKKHKAGNLFKNINHSEKDLKSKSSIIQQNNQDLDLNADTEKKLKIARICCFLCGLKIKNKIDLVKHLCNHQGSPLSCRKCWYVYENRSHFNAHIAFCSALKANGPKGMKHEFSLSDIIGLDATKFAVCSYCGQRFGSNSYLRYHVKHLTCLRTDGPTKCKICRSCFKTDLELQDHISKLHNHTCPVCKKVFPSVSLLAAHRKKHVRVHQCARCVASFRTRALLRKHAKLHDLPAPEAKQKMFECSSCTFKSAKKYNYKRHVRQMHGQAPAHACSKCPAILRTPHSLREHERAHGAPQFECSKCAVKFAYRASLVRHLAAHDKPAARADRLAASAAPAAPAAPALAAPAPDKDAQKEADKKSGNKVRLSIAVGQSPAEQQFLSLVDVRSGEMLTLPVCYAHLLLPPQGAQYNPGGDDIVVITNVPSLECDPPLVMYQESGH